MLTAAQEFKSLALDVRRFHYWAYQTIGGLTATNSKPETMFAPSERRVVNHDPHPPLAEPPPMPTEREGDEEEEKP